MSTAQARVPGYSWIQLGLYQLGWWSCVLGAAHGQPWLGPVVVLAALAIHLGCVQRPLGELRLMLWGLVVGILGDGLCGRLQAVAFVHGAGATTVPPVWMLALWPAFAVSLRLSLSLLQSRLWLAAILGALGGPLAYEAGRRLGALSAPHGLAAFLAAVGLEWAIAMPLLAYLSRPRLGSGPSPAQPLVTHAA